MMRYSSEAQFRRLQDIVRKIHYKPHCKLDVHRISDYFVVNIVVVMIVPDINSPERRTVIQFASTVDLEFMEQMTDFEVVERYVSRAILEAELHEMDEWLKFEGRCVKEPHPEAQTPSAR
jgi:hypothetical protein